MKYSILSLLLLVSCATPLTQKEKSFVYIKKTKLSASNGYNMAVAYLAKNLGDSNTAIKLKDPKNNKVISQISINCSNYIKNGMLDINTYMASFTVELDFKDNKARVSLTGDNYSSRGINGAYIATNASFTSRQAEGLKSCANDLSSQIISSLKVNNSNNW